MFIWDCSCPKRCKISESQVLVNTGVHSQEQSGTAVGIFDLYTPHNSGKKAD